MKEGIIQYEIEFTKEAEKNLKKLPSQIQSRISKAIEGLKTNSRPSGCKKLTAHQRTYRIRIGDYRVIYDIYDNEIKIVVLNAEKREDVYR